MYLAVQNNAFLDRYPNVQKVFNVVNYYERQTGRDYSAIEVNSIDELLSLEALIKSTCEYYSGILLNGTKITIKEEGNNE